MKLVYVPLLAVNNIGFLQHLLSGCFSTFGKRKNSTWDVARLSESVKIHSPAARVFYAFQKSRNIPRAWITLSCTENYSVTL